MLGQFILGVVTVTVFTVQKVNPEGLTSKKVEILLLLIFFTLFFVIKLQTNQLVGI